MLEVGRYKNLIVEKKTDFGVYLKERDPEGPPVKKGEEHVLLPSAQVPEAIKPGDEIRVFIYRDSKDRLIATTNKPAIAMGEVAPLTVKEVTRMGGFLDWGLEKDLFLGK